METIVNLKLLSINGKVFINPRHISHIVKAEEVEVYVIGQSEPVAKLSRDSAEVLLKKVGGYSGL